MNSPKAKPKDHPLTEALYFADEVLAVLNVVCERTLIVGSVRRQRPIVHDLDLVVIPRGETIRNKKGVEAPMPGQNRWFDIPRILTEQLPEASIIRKGDEVITAEVKGMQVDINRATEANWGIRTLVKTGPLEFNIELCKQATALGMEIKLQRGVVVPPHVAGNMKITLQAGVVCKDNSVVVGQVENDVFKILYLAVISPEHRDEAALKLRDYAFVW